MMMVRLASGLEIRLGYGLGFRLVLGSLVIVR